MGRTMPTECRHGVVIDWGDFGPCQNCDEHPDTDDCPNLRDCLTCEDENGSREMTDDEVRGAWREGRLVSSEYLASHRDGWPVRWRLLWGWWRS